MCFVFILQNPATSMIYDLLMICFSIKMLVNNTWLLDFIFYVSFPLALISLLHLFPFKLPLSMDKKCPQDGTTIRRNASDFVGKKIMMYKKKYDIYMHVMSRMHTSDFHSVLGCVSNYALVHFGH